MEQLKVKIEERARLWEEQKVLLARADSENRDFNTEERAAYDKMEADMQTLDTYIERKQRHVERGNNLRQPQPAVVGNLALADDASESPELVMDAAPSLRGRDNIVQISDFRARKEYQEGFVRYLRTGDERAIEQARATLAVDVDAGGGFFAATSRLLAGVIQNLSEAIAIRQFCTNFPCGYGETLGIISLNGGPTRFTRPGSENKEAKRNTEVTFGKRELKAHPYEAMEILVSLLLLQNQHIDVESLIVDQVTTALALTMNEEIMIGTGNLQPLGLFTAHADGIPTSQDYSTHAEATNFTANHLIGAQGALKQGYQARARWLFHPDAMTKIRMLALTTGEKLWQPGLQAGQPSVVLGKPYITDEQVPHTFTTGKYVGMYGDYSHYFTATANSLTVQRLKELYAKTRQVGLLFDMVAFDGMPVKAEAFKRLKLA